MPDPTPSAVLRQLSADMDALGEAVHGAGVPDDHEPVALAFLRVSNTIGRLAEQMDATPEGRLLGLRQLATEVQRRVHELRADADALVRSLPPDDRERQ